MSHARETTLADVTEDELLARLFPIFAARPPGADDAGGEGSPARTSSVRTSPMLVGPGDDTAVLATPSGAVVATTDTMVRGRDWRDEWSSGRDVGAKVVAQNLADVAAMGARPTGILLTLVADPRTRLDWVLELSHGIAEAADRADVAVLGGDLSSAPAGTLMVSVTALGDLVGREPVLRSGARAGDVVGLSGTLGLAAAGWRLLEAGRVDDDAEAVARQRCPRPPLGQGPLAADAGATSMLDLSDGLLRDADRVARASGVRLALDSEALQPHLDRLAHLGPDLARECVLAGGEEHSLLATFPRSAGPPAGWQRLGGVVALDPGEPPGVSVDGRLQTVRGWDHFRA